ncbi:MAG: His-Xaa-Ser system protein HxsD [Elusimicrobia bacterium]|nr:His-Xaa-Ser system protein HxsD [Elusimicrobiota bacterium]
MQKNQAVRVDVPTGVYSLEAVYAACYGFIDRAYVRLDEGPKDAIRVELAPKNGAQGADLRRLEGEFFNELLHHALRLKVAVANQKIREYVVTRALLSAQAAAPLGPDGQVEGAGAGIAVNQPGPDGVPAEPGSEAAVSVRQPGPDGVPPEPGSEAAVSVRQPGPDGVPPEPGSGEDGSTPKPGPDGYPVGYEQPGAKAKNAQEADEDLAREIQKLLAEVEKGADKEDPLGIVAPWEETVGKAAGAASSKPAAKAAAKKASKKKPEKPGVSRGS